MSEHRKPSRRPTPKVAAATLGGAVTTLIVWVLGRLGVEVTPEVAAALATVVAFAAGYVTPR